MSVRRLELSALQWRKSSYSKPDGGQGGVVSEC